MHNHYKTLLLILLSVTLCQCTEDTKDDMNEPDLVTAKDQGTDGTKSADMTNDLGSTEDMTKDMGCPGATKSMKLGGDRPAQAYLPPGHDGCSPTPLVVLLHGYSANARFQDRYFGLSSNIESLGFILVTPEGKKDANNAQFWNASEACCDFGNTNVDDVGYIRSLIEEAKKTYNVDEKRVFLIGHSNGGFMSYRMACEASDIITGIVSLAGAASTVEGNCTPTNPVSVLQVHGTKDETIAYEGGSNTGAPYPGAQESAARWAKRNGCDETPVDDGAMLQLLNQSQAPDTTIQTWKNCKGGTDVTLWSIVDGSHIPGFKSGFGITALEHIFKYPRPD